MLFRSAVRHSGSEAIEVSLERFEDGIRLSVEDWGRGFRAGGDLSELGLGLLSMEERARVVRAQFQIASTPGQGTMVRCWAPLRQLEGGPDPEDQGE